MSLSARQITPSNISTYGVISAPDKLTGTANENKRVFDRLIRDCVASLYNSLIGDLTAQTAAGELGFTPITDISATNIQGAINTLKTIADTKANTADVDTALALKADKSVTDLHYKSVTFDETTGVFTFTKENGTATVIDTLLEKIAINFRYDAATQSLIIELKDGTTQTVPLSAFITETEFVDSNTIDFTVANHVVTAAIKNGSITDAMLDSALIETIQGYVAQASASALSAATSATNAETSKTQAQTAQTGAESARDLANTYAGQAEGYKNTAASASSAAATSASTALSASDSATASATSASNSASSASTSAAQAQGKVLTSITENAAGHMIVTYADGTTLDLGAVMADGYVRVTDTQPTDERCKVWVKPEGQPTGPVLSVNGRTGVVTGLEEKGKITVGGTEYTVVISTTDAGTAGCITFVVD